MLMVYVLFSVLGQVVPETAKLEPCPDKPNCVSTQADSSDSEHYMPALAYSADSQEVLATVEAVLLGMPRSKLKSKTNTRIHITFRSRIFRFVDDVEVVLDDANKQLHFRSAARMGYSDIGVNRKRMTEFVSKLKEALPEAGFD